MTPSASRARTLPCWVQASSTPNVPIPKFACACGRLRRTSESMWTLASSYFLVCFLDLKFAQGLVHHRANFRSSTLGLDPLDLYRRAVGENLCDAVHDVVGVVAHADH